LRSSWGRSVARRAAEQRHSYQPEVQSRLVAIVAHVTAEPRALPDIAQGGLACPQSHGPGVVDKKD
jgi:hypothetical protein